VAARAQLAAFAGRQVATLDRDRTFFQRLLDLRIPLAMRLVTTRGLTGEALGDAFEEALKPRVQRAATALNMPGGEAALERFRAYFDVRELPVSTEIVFACGPSGSVITMVGARAPLEIESPALCWALFDVYLGDRAISAAGRRSLIGGFPTLLAGSR
jgi:hypothetical protein